MSNPIITTPFDALILGLDNYVRPFLGLETRELEVSLSPHDAVFVEPQHFGRVSFGSYLDALVTHGCLPSVFDRGKKVSFPPVVSTFVQSLVDNPIQVGWGVSLSIQSQLLSTKLVGLSHWREVGLILACLVLGYQHQASESRPLVLEGDHAFSRLSYPFWFGVSTGLLPVSISVSVEQVSLWNSQLFFDMGLVAGFASSSMATVEQKLGFLGGLSLGVGSLVFLNTRASSMKGTENQFEGSTLALVLGVSEVGVSVRKFPTLHTSVASAVRTYQDLPDSVRSLYLSVNDYVGFDPYWVDEEIPWTQLGVGYAFSTDSFFHETQVLTTLESVHPVTVPLFTGASFLSPVRVSVPEAVFVLLSERSLFGQHGLPSEDEFRSTFPSDNYDTLSSLVSNSMLVIDGMNLS